MRDVQSNETTGSEPLVRPGMAAIATAVAAGTASLWVNHRARKAERLHPPVGRSMQVDGGALHYAEMGDGPPVLLLHGNGVRLEDFIACGLFDALARRHRVIAIDRPGFGHSERPRGRLWTPLAQAALFRRLLERIGVERPVIVGHSWGTLVAVEMGLCAPTDVSGLVLVSGYYYPTARADVWLNLPGATPLIGDVLDHTVLPLAWRLTLNRAVRLMFAPAPVPDNFFEVVSREMILRPRQIRAASEDAVYLVPAARRLQKRYADLTMPVTLVAGEGDMIVDPSRQSARLHREIRQSELILTPGVGHMVHHGGTTSLVNAVASMIRGA
ncbi:Haloalkane dehalogenase [Cupriavidus pinatubonensis]|uniref:Haloalkane dehalogenase n=2 Tax=Cupriavidus pinatubonensis TaxID=248026 RepID=A0ABM8X021_9BURK|nr:Haloalkane dehalogenase [Cupriavidus pinatubonensis]